MNTKARIAAAVAAGYLLGRTKRLKLAIMIGGLIAGQKIPTNPRDIGRELQKVIDNNEQLSNMSDQVRGELTDAAKAAATQMLTERLHHVSDNLRGHVNELPEDADDAAETSEDTDSPQQTSAKTTTKKASATTKSTTKKAPAKKSTSTTKKAPAKKTAKKSTSTAKKAPAKKSSRSRSGDGS